MANDLERFLQQAAERLAQKAGNRPTQAMPRPSDSFAQFGTNNAATASRDRHRPGRGELTTAWQPGGSR